MTTTVHRNYVERTLLAVRIAEQTGDDSAFLGVLIEAAVEDDLTSEDLLSIVAGELSDYLDRTDPGWHNRLIREHARVAAIHAKEVAQ